MDSHRGLHIVANPQSIQYVIKKEACLHMMDSFVPWVLLLQLISPKEVYPQLIIVSLDISERFFVD